jgi:2-dehydro-3-deoxyphosphogluconate aldolase/(4S)-4-hydroxy-2-oxoglutarate aldolase
MLTVEQAFPTGVAGVIRTQDSDVAFHACLAAAEAGIGTLEVTTTVPACFEVVRGLIASTGGNMPIGVGTVMDAGTVHEAAEAGAAFVVTPLLLPKVAEACRNLDVLCVLGALTPTEIHQARLAGAQLVKVFPVASLGGPAYIGFLNGPMPDAPLWVSGGVEIDQIEAYLKLGVKAVGLTSALFPPDALARGDIDAIKRLAKRAAAVTGAPANL